MTDHTFPTVVITDEGDTCAICGEPLRAGDVVVDVYGDLYHAECLAAGTDVVDEEADADEPAR